LINSKEILETIRMIQDECLDIRTTTMGISLLDCGDTDIDKSCQKIYDKICKKAEHLVSTGEQIEKEYGIPIINKRVSVTPIAIMAGISGGDPVKYALALEKAAQTIGVNFIGGYSALVQKGFAAGDLELINSIPRALAETQHICSSVNIGSTKAGINMDAVKIMGQKVKEAAELTKDNDCIAAGKLVVFCNAPEDNPFTAVVLQFTIPIAASSAIIPLITSGVVSPGITIISRPTEQTAVIASSFSIVSAPLLAALIIPASSLTGINAPDKPPTDDDAITPPFLTASLSIARQAVVPAPPHCSMPISSRM
jgi:uncharacterized protein (UPF0210 family)